MIFVAVAGVLAAVVCASMAYTHHRDQTGEQRSWMIATLLFLLIGVASGTAWYLSNPGLFATTSQVAEEGDDEQPPPTVAIASPEPGTDSAPLDSTVLASWHPVGTFTGSNDGDTPVFAIKGKNWRLFWDIKELEGQTRFSYFVYPAASPTPIDRDEMVSGEVKEMRIFQSGEFFVRVKGANVEWSISVEDSYPDEPTPDAESAEQ